MSYFWQKILGCIVPIKVAFRAARRKAVHPLTRIANLLLLNFGAHDQLLKNVVLLQNHK